MNVADGDGGDPLAALLQRAAAAWVVRALPEVSSLRCHGFLSAADDRPQSLLRHAAERRRDTFGSM